MSKRDGTRRRLLSADERLLWGKITRSVAPLREAAAAETDVEIAEKPPRRPASKSGAATDSARPAALPPPALSSLGRRQRRQVARGKEPIDARLDLHGLSQAQAHSALRHFLRETSAHGARLVLVITGKGGRGEGGRGVLKRQVPHWLASSEFRTFVVSYDDAGIRHGGEGALYVRLRRPRQ